MFARFVNTIIYNPTKGHSKQLRKQMNLLLKHRFMRIQLTEGTHHMPIMLGSGITYLRVWAYVTRDYSKCD